ncbi:MAG: hypothetical protein DMF61_17125 [Blastocatellia bacterium AA13]|nr:MAG: hypothetical protein DMF61_17125 [Blastocatellia bacterium AA13]
MPLIIIIAVIGAALVWWYKSEHSSTLNEKAYLRGRGYSADGPEIRGPIPLDARVRSLIDSLDDVTPYARQRAAEEVALMCDEGQKDSRFFAPLVAALDDNSAAVRGAAVTALEKLGDSRAQVHLKRVVDSDDSIHVRAIARKVVERMSAVPSSS